VNKRKRTPERAQEGWHLNVRQTVLLWLFRSIHRGAKHVVPDAQETTEVLVEMTRVRGMVKGVKSGCHHHFGERYEAPGNQAVLRYGNEIHG